MNSETETPQFKLVTGTSLREVEKEANQWLRERADTIAIRDFKVTTHPLSFGGVEVTSIVILYAPATPSTGRTG